VSAIVVKLEGESKSLIEREKGAFQQFNPSVVTADQRAGFQQSGSATENHKILYDVSQVFPIATGEKAADPVYTLRAGKHEYPFKFTIPHDNGCSHLFDMSKEFCRLPSQVSVPKLRLDTTSKLRSIVHPDSEKTEEQNFLSGSSHLIHQLS
jgi:hypothetical protein